MNLRRAIEDRLAQALAKAGAPAGAPAVVIPAARPEFGDYQANGIMPAAKRMKTNPRKLAEQVLAVADLSDLADSVEIAGPGFLNVRLKDDWLAAQLALALADEHLGVERPPRPQRVVVDYSHPNLAKEMHVGHLRTTIIGDAICRVLEFLGHEAIRQNHVGDWGTQFGMLMAYLEKAGQDASELSDLEEFYRKAKDLFDRDPAFADLARQYVVRLQSGDPSVRQKWKRFLDTSMDHCRAVYRRLGVLLSDQDIRGESAYNDDLPDVVADLAKAGLLTESLGAQCVFLEEFQGKDGKALPLIVQKSDEGYLYATTDLAALRYRVRQLHADRILYVVDARQSLHFRQLFAVARKAGFVPADFDMEHIAFGMMLGDDGKPFKTRTGGTVKLAEVLDESVGRAYALVSAKSPPLPEDQRRDIARVVGIGAVKYADLSQNRTSDYVFAFDKMLSLEGNTAPYMQYAYARIRSIFRKGPLKDAAAHPTGAPPGASPITLAAPAERALGLKLLQFPETLAAVAAECLPNLLCNYLYDLAGAFMGFYESCPVLQSPEPLRTSRLMLCDLTARTIRTGLGLLGIQTLEQM